jgi:hypothetical protein
VRRLLTQGLGIDEPAWLPEAEALWRDVPALRASAIIPVWRRPWVVVGRDTFAGDVLLRLGIRNVYAVHADRYPRPGLDELQASGADLAVLPDEPYLFTETDGPEAFPGLRSVLVSGRDLTWCGPSLVEAHARLWGAFQVLGSGP